MKIIATVTYEDVTPKMAMEWLTHNTDNRHMRPTFVEFLAQEIKRGQWLVSNDAIVFDWDGVLRNGQHRLHAIMAAGVTCRVAVQRDVDPRACTIYDTGGKRTQADNLKLPKDLVADVNLLAYILNPGTRSRVANVDTLDIVDWWRPTYDTFLDAINNHIRGRGNSSPVRVGMGLRWAVGSRYDRTYALDQFRAYVLADAPKMSMATATMWKRVNNGDYNHSRISRIMLIVALYHASAYTRRETAPVMKDRAVTTDEVRQWLRMAKDAYMAGPDASGHPYVFASAPVVEHVLSGAVKAQHDARVARNGQGATP